MQTTPLPKGYLVIQTYLLRTDASCVTVSCESEWIQSRCGFHLCSRADDGVGKWQYIQGGEATLCRRYRPRLIAGSNFPSRSQTELLCANTFMMWCRGTGFLKWNSTVCPCVKSSNQFKSLTLSLYIPILLTMWFSFHWWYFGCLTRTNESLIIHDTNELSVMWS